ncbi:hypothetical protein HanIR_Chr03g0134051 [Helianthus annuus]|nr:hypothetical protein HanIR_Chr03g0134051 [Helianthus annuus]
MLGLVFCRKAVGRHRKPFGATVSYGSHRSLRWRSDVECRICVIHCFSSNLDLVNPLQVSISFYNVPQHYQMAW